MIEFGKSELNKIKKELEVFITSKKISSMNYIDSIKNSISDSTQNIVNLSQLKNNIKNIKSDFLSFKENKEKELNDSYQEELNKLVEKNKKLIFENIFEDKILIPGISYVEKFNELKEETKFLYKNIMISYMSVIEDSENYLNNLSLQKEINSYLNQLKSLKNKDEIFEALNFDNFLNKRKEMVSDIIKVELVYDLEFDNYYYKPGQILKEPEFEIPEPEKFIDYLYDTFEKDKLKIDNERVLEYLEKFAHKKEIVLKLEQLDYCIEKTVFEDYVNELNRLADIPEEIAKLSDVELRLGEIEYESLLLGKEYKSEFLKALEQNKIIEDTIENKEIVNSFLTADKELEQKNLEQQKEIEALSELSERINSLTDMNLFQNVSNVFDAIKEYFGLVKTGNKSHLNTMNEIFALTNSTDALFSKDFCSLIYLCLYVSFSAMSEEPLENINNAEEYNKKLDELKNKGLKSLPGYIEVNQIKFENWNAKADFMKDSKFAKSYANFYNFYTKEKNPFNKTLKDKDFEKMQSLAIRAKELLESEDTPGSQKKFEELFYQPLDGKNHSIHTYVNLISDFLQELNEPIEFELLVNFGISLIDFMKNLALETGTSLLLEITLDLFSREVIKLGDKKYSLMGIYNELYMLKKILYLIRNDDQNLTELLESNIKEISHTVLRDSHLATILKEEAYFAMSGLDFSSSLLFDLNKLLNNTEDRTGAYLDLLYTYKYKDNEGKEQKQIWNLKAINLPAWVKMKYIINKHLVNDPKLSFLSFDSKKQFDSMINNLSSSENSYTFLCSILNKKDYVEYLNKNNNYNYNDKQITEILDCLPATVNDNNFNYYESYLILKEKYSKILQLTKTIDYKHYVVNIRRDISLFYKVITYNYNAILDAINSSEVTPLLDTIMRLLPTTRLLFGTFNLPLDKYLDKILSWFDEVLFCMINFLKKLMYENKIKFTENYKRERLFLIKNTWDYRIRALNLLIDIIYQNLAVTSLCLKHDYRNDKEILIDIYQQLVDKVEDFMKEEIDSKLENPKDKNINDKVNDILPHTPNDIDKDKIIEDIEKNIENKVIVVEKDNSNSENGRNIIIIFPGQEDSNYEDTYNENKDNIITKPIDTPEDFLEELKKDEISKIEINFDSDWLENILDFLKPGNEQIKDDIFNRYITKDLNELFYQNTSGNNTFKKDEVLNNRYQELNSNAIQYSDSGYVSYIDYSKINFKSFNEVLSNFDLGTYEKIKTTSLEFFNSF